MPHAPPTPTIAPNYCCDNIILLHYYTSYYIIKSVDDYEILPITILYSTRSLTETLFMRHKTRLALNFELGILYVRCFIRGRLTEMKYKL